MQNSRGRGKGRGRGRGKSSDGPALPFKLRKELEISGAESGQQKVRGSMFKVSQRKEQRKAARKLGRRPPKPSGGNVGRTAHLEQITTQKHLSQKVWAAYRISKSHAYANA